MVDKGPPPELVGATDEPIQLGASTNEVNFQVRPRRGPLGLDAAGPSKYYLALENVTGTGFGAGTYGVYVDVPEGASPIEFQDRRVGTISTFGVPERSRSDETHDGSGVTYPFDMTDVVQRLTDAGQWDPNALRVSIVPDQEEGSAEAEAGEVQVGRIGLYTR
jgi:tyrosinase